MCDRTEELEPAARHEHAIKYGRFDFAAPSAMFMTDAPTREAIWRAYLNAFDRFDRPGEYVPLLGMEMHPTFAPSRLGGDRQTIFKSRERDVPVSTQSPIEDLFDEYEARDDVLMEVHIGGGVPDWNHFMPAEEPLLEIASGFGNAEWLLQEALHLGYRPALCGGSDLHLGTMGGPRALETKRGRFRMLLSTRDCGLGAGPVAAVMADELTRDALWTSIRNRHTYASTFPRVYLNVKCNGAGMGDEAEVTDDLELTVACHAQEPIERIDVILGEHCIKTWRPQMLDFEVGETFAVAGIPPGDWLYVRVQQIDNEYSWSTPIWLTRREASHTPSGDWPLWNDPEITLDELTPDTQAAKHLPDLEEYLAREEEPDRVEHIVPVAIVHECNAKAALFYACLNPGRQPVAIRWFFEYPIPRLRVDWGWRTFGVRDCQRIRPDGKATRFSQRDPKWYEKEENLPTGRMRRK
jgi:hypothetical protein